jgi:hypothetical protein
MSAKVDRFCDWLRDRLNAIEGWLESVKTDLQSLPGKVRKALRTKLDEAQTKLQAQRERLEQTRAEFKARPPHAVPEREEMIAEWKAEPETRAPAAGADRAEAHVAQTIDRAVASIDDVRDAMLYAAVGHLPHAGN